MKASWRFFMKTSPEIGSTRLSAVRRRRTFLRDNGLTIALCGLFVFAIVAMSLTGWSAYNTVLIEHGEVPLELLGYLQSGHFVSAVFENWESEFLQMAAYVMLTAFLFQRGSAESRDPDRPEDAPSTPPPSSLTTFLHAYSLGIALAGLFLASFVLHLWGSHRAAEAEAALHGTPRQSLIAHFGDMEFWFESFQNWQSEFLATAALVVLSIVLRFRGSPESKHVAASNAETGR
jgi:hypothetical protein